MTYYARGSAHEVISDGELRSALAEALGKLGKRGKVLAVPPDFTRFHSRAGRITELAWEYYGAALTDVLPATGTHFPVSEQEKLAMFGKVPRPLFRVHRWKENLETLGRVPEDFIAKVSEGRLCFDWPAQVDSLIVKGGYDLILSIGQVVPHEVIGMAGLHEEPPHRRRRTGGHQQEPLPRRGLRHGAHDGTRRHSGAGRSQLRRRPFRRHLPIVYIHTVVGRQDDGSLALKGLFVGDDIETFLRAAELSLKVNFTMVDEPFPRVVVYLQPDEFKSTWLGNKAIYRTRMALADRGELIILAPGVRQFGEDPVIDALIRKYGYFGTPRVLQLVAENEDLQKISAWPPT